MRRPLLAAAFLLAAAGCARSYAPLVAQPVAPGRGWVSALHRDHPLAGKIWDVRAARFVDEAGLVSALSGAEVVLLGETHDNVDHHVLQARMIQAIAAAGRRPAVAFEMLSTEQQPELDGALAAKAPTPDAVAKAVGWDESGWPAFKTYYRPIFAAALEAGLPLVGANLPRKQVREVMKKGAEALPAPVRARIDWVGAPSPDEAKALREEMQASHCGQLPETLLEPMLLGQRARDAQMAERLAEVGAGRGAVLVAGSGHARTDRGVPVYLEPAVRGRTVAVAFREVSGGRNEPAAYAIDEGAAALPYDFVVFTPGVGREDPCKGFGDAMRARAQREKATPVEPKLAP
jgi:uncharacterized iron-regulated protein